LHRQTVSGLPLLNPLFFQYPNDANTFNNSLQFFYGDNILVSPVTEENSTSVSIYLPKDIFYDYWTHERIEGTGSWVQLHDVPFTSIPLHIRGGSIIALREDSANTTTELRKKNFVLLIATNATGQATGSLYLDEGDAIEQPHTSEIVFGYDNGRFSIGGTFGYHTNAVIRNITVLQAKVPSNSSGGYEYSSKEGSTTVVTEVPLTGAFTTEL
jgi:alpha-glucosidase